MAYCVIEAAKSFAYITRDFFPYTAEEKKGKLPSEYGIAIECPSYKQWSGLDSDRKSAGRGDLHRQRKRNGDTERATGARHSGELPDHHRGGQRDGEESDSFCTDRDWTGYAGVYEHGSRYVRRRSAQFFHRKCHGHPPADLEAHGHIAARSQLP